MIRLAVRTLRHRLGGFVAAFAAMFLGAAIVMACGGLMESGICTAVPPQQLADADVVVAGEQRYEVPEMDYSVILPERSRIDAGLVDTVAALPEVRDVSGHVFDHPAPDGAIDAVAVVAEAGTSVGQLRDVVDTELTGTAVTLVGDERGLAERREALVSADGLIAMAGVFGSMALMVSVFGVASMLALSVQQRHRELAMLRAVGTTPQQLRKLVLGETVILATVATGLALVPGRWLGEFIFQRLVDADVVTEGVIFHLGWIPMVVAISVAMLAAVGGALVAGRRAAATRPTQALAEAGLPERRRMGFGRVFLGLVVLAGGISLAAVTMTVLSGELASSTGMPAVIVMAIGLAALSPALTRPLAALLRWPLAALTGRPGRLAMLNVRAGIDRVAAVVAPVIVLTGVAAGMLYTQFTEQDAVEQEYAESLAADAVVTAEESVDSGVGDRIGALPGVASASTFVRSVGFVEQPLDSSLRNGGAGWTLQGVTPDDVGGAAAVTVTEGSLGELRGATVAMTAEHAEELGVRLGDPVTLRMGDNSTLEVEVVTLVATDDDNDTLWLPGDVLATHTTTGHTTEIRVTGDGSVGTDQVIATISELAAAEEGLTVADRETLFAAHNDAQNTQAFASYTIVIVIVTYTAISVINALASSTNARRREFGLQRLTGFTRGQVLRMLAAEGVLVGAVGVLLGTVAAVGTAVPFSLGRADSVYPSGSPWVYVAVTSGAMLLTLLATLVPGWWETRQRPVDAAVAS